MKNNVFDRNRMWNTLKLDVATNWRQFFTPFLVMLGGQVCVFMVIMLSMRHLHIENVLSKLRDDMVSASWVIAVVGMIMGGSLLFANMKTKQGRIAFEALPASNLEKFLSRWLTCTVGMGVTFLVALLAADVFRVVLSLLLGIGLTDSVFLGFFAIGDATSCDRLFAALTSVSVWHMILWVSNYLLSLLMFHAVFMLGSAFFRRYSLLLTLLLLTAWFIASFFIPYCREFSNLMGGGPTGYGDARLMINIGRDIVITAACYWGSFKLFCRSQAISNKWINL